MTELEVVLSVYGVHDDVGVGVGLDGVGVAGDCWNTTFLILLLLPSDMYKAPEGLNVMEFG